MIEKRQKIFKDRIYCYLFAITSFLLNIEVARALEVNSYPNIPGLPPLSDSSDLPALAIYWFGVLIYIAGILSLISFTIGAISLVNPDPEAHGNAKDRMKGAALGLALTLASFLIIKTINIELVTPRITSLPSIQVNTIKSSEEYYCPCDENECYRINKNPVIAGDSVSFYSEPFGWLGGARAGSFSVSPKKKETVGDLNYNYNGVDRPIEYKQKYKTLRSRAGSIKIKGDYLVILFSDSHCQTFRQEVPNLYAQQPNITKIEVVPIL